MLQIVCQSNDQGPFSVILFYYINMLYKHEQTTSNKEMNRKPGSDIQQATIFVRMPTFFVRSAVMLEKSAAACYR
jgi:hypothetical protein